MDRAIYRWFNRLAAHTSWAHAIFRLYADYGVVLFAVLLVVAYLVARRSPGTRMLAAVVWAAISAVAALGVGQLIGNAVDRARPYAAMSDVHVLISRTTDFSFPSDHATMAGAVAAGLLLANRRWGIVAAVAAVLMAITRVYVGAHYPSDVVAGLALGTAVAVVGFYTIVPLLDRLAGRLVRTPLRPLLASDPGAGGGSTGG